MQECGKLTIGTTRIGLQSLGIVSETVFTALLIIVLGTVKTNIFGRPTLENVKTMLLCSIHQYI